MKSASLNNAVPCVFNFHGSENKSVDDDEEEKN